jgi:alpha-N-arabinofuranosidase
MVRLRVSLLLASLLAMDSNQSVAQQAAAPADQGPAAAGSARLIIDVERSRTTIDPRLFGSFLEHLGRAIYGGVYEPSSKLSDAGGFRKDLLQEVRKLGVPLVRYPGGNFVSGYNWLDGVGPKKDRPRVLDRAWNSIETNQFGTNEFMAWCRRAGAQPLIAVNLGSGTAESAANLVEYCNVPGGTRWSELRRQHGIEAPHAIKSWCLGNELDGPWQIGHMSAPEYGRKAADAARQMRQIDKSIELIVGGSCTPSLPTYMEWDRQVLEQCYEDVDGVSLHRYLSNGKETGGDSKKFLAMNLSLEKQILEMAAVCDMVRGRRKSNKRLWLAVDEWNVWYRANNFDGQRKEAPPLLEEEYNLEDALVVGGVINTLVRQAERVRIGCLAQLANVIAPLTTSKDGLLRQTIYYPYAWALAHARGQVLDLAAESDTYDVPGLGAVPFVDAVGTWDPRTNTGCLLLLNRDLAKDRELTITWRGTAPGRMLKCEVLTGADLKASNTFQRPERVVPRPFEPPAAGQRMVLKLPARSYTLLCFAK